MSARQIEIHPDFIVYREKSEDIIQIVAIAHARRQPNYWKHRK